MCRILRINSRWFKVCSVFYGSVNEVMFSKIVDVILMCYCLSEACEGRNLGAD